MKKNIIFCAYNLDVGGIETALVSLLNNLDYNKYNVSLFLVKKEGLFLNQISKKVNIINFNVSENKNVFLRKIINFCKLNYFRIKYKNKFDFAAAYATTIKACTKLAYHFSKNNAIWVHGNFCNQYKTNKDLKEFLDFIDIWKYKKIVFVSNSIKDSYTNRGIKFNADSYVFNNFIDIKRIKELSNADAFPKKKTTLVNVSRYEEKDKNLLLLLRTVKKLVDSGYDFDLWMVGDGPDKKLYLNYVKDNHLQDVVTFFGSQSNPFIYYKSADAVVMTSVSEGNPVVFVESKIMGKPIITTKVSDALTDIAGKYGIVTDFTDDSYYNGLKQFLDNGFEMEKFDAEKFNQEILEKLIDVIEN